MNGNCVHNDPMTRLEFSWGNSSQNAQFTTSCPHMAEVMMQSQAGFPERPADVQEAFNALYGAERGAFETFLRENLDTDKAFIDTRIPGLCIRVVRATNKIIDLKNRPFHYL